MTIIDKFELLFYTEMERNDGVLSSSAYRIKFLPAPNGNYADCQGDYGIMAMS